MNNNNNEYTIDISTIKPRLISMDTLHSIENSDKNNFIDKIELNEDENIYNNWTTSNREVIKKWMEGLTNSSFVYQILLDKYQKNMNRILVISLILTSILNVISSLSSAFAALDNSYKWTIFSLNIITFIISAILTFLTGAMNIYKWDEKTSTLTQFIQKVKNFNSTLKNINILPDKIKPDAVEFISKNDEIFENIIQQSPNINHNDFIMAKTILEKYKTKF
jgi:hypothetical protein